MADFSGVNAEVSRLTDVVSSAVTLINGIADKVAAAVAENDAGDNTALAGLADSLRAQSTSLASSVAANTPAETGGGETGSTTEPIAEPGAGGR